MKIRELLTEMDLWAPFAGAKDFDNVGLLVGDREAQTDFVLLCMDVTADILAEAEALGAGVVLAHHPLIFRAQKSFTAEGLPFRAARSGIAIVACHTNLDCAPGGVNDTLISAIGLEKTEDVPGTEGCCAMCACPAELSDPEALAKQVCRVTGLPYVRLARGGRPLERVAVCCGGGAGFIDAAVAAGADGMITGDIKYASAVDAVRSGFTLIDAGHYETERLVLPVVRAHLSKKFPDCRFEIASSCRSAFEFISRP